MRTSNTSAGSDLVTCPNVRSLMEAFVDGELSPEQTLEMEAHVEDCQRCQASADFLRTLSAAVKAVVHPHTAEATTRAMVHDGTMGEDHSTAANAVLVVEAGAASGAIPPSFMARLEQAIEVEIEREAAATDQTSRGSWIGRITVFAAAASASLWFGIRTFGPEASSLTSARDGVPIQARTRNNSGVSGAPLQEDEVSTLEGALDRLIDYHSAPPAPDVTSAELLPRLEPDVGVRMQLPKLDAYGARWEGASLVPVRNNQRAASFRYQLPKNRVTLYVFNASRLRVQDSAHLQRETPQPVYFGQWRGYNVAAKETRGVGYALATDMDGPAVARMINDVH
jgi:anti-sigma factor RsiW